MLEPMSRWHEVDRSRGMTFFGVKVGFSFMMSGSRTTNLMQLQWAYANEFSSQILDFGPRSRALYDLTSDIYLLIAGRQS